MKAITFVIVLAVLCSICGVATAATVTQAIMHQGTLTDSGGNPLTGTFTVTFRLYNVANGGTALATDTHTLTATNGKFTTTLSFPSGNYNGQGLWLGIQRAPDPEKTPRTVFRPVPYALSLRPGALIKGSGAAHVLKVMKTGDEGMTMNVTSSGNDSPGIRVFTYGSGSPGINSTTIAYNAWSFKGFTAGESSGGVYMNTIGASSPGVMALTQGDNSQAMSGVTHGDLSDAIVGISNGDESNAAFFWGKGTNSTGVYAWSNQHYGIFADTEVAGGYGVFTPDKMSALTYDTNSGDVAEYLQVSESVAPGTVLVIGKGGVLEPSAVAYDTRVAGIVSTSPGVSLGTNESGNPGEALVAVAGKVPCNVDASGAPIHEGDLLATSGTPGYAMKATDPQIGTILGKAMGSLESGTGRIEVLVTLQ
ncbi:MAG: hypothetical protein LUQ25_03070 [Methanoregulaceae archaeon]|nr:hypothetical protein [Methanoregulaceae archaeon]